MRKALFAAGFRYRKNDKRLPGCPDIVLPKYRTVIFVNGCFWHKHDGCKWFVWPKSNTGYWQKKITGNVERDKATYACLLERGWRIIIVWECELKRDVKEETLHRLAEKIHATAAGHTV